MSPSGGSVVWQVFGSNATGSFVYGPVFRAFDLDGLDALTGLDFTSGTGLGILNLTTNDYLNSQVDQTFIESAISDSSEFRSSIGAGTSSFSGSAADLSGNINPARFSSSDFPMLSAVTAANAAAARSAIGAGTSSFDGNYSSLSGSPSIPSNVSDLTNDSGFLTGITQTQVQNAITNASTFRSNIGAGTSNFSGTQSAIAAAITNASSFRTSIGFGIQFVWANLW